MELETHGEKTVWLARLHCVQGIKCDLVCMCVQPLKEVVKEALTTFLKSQNRPFTLSSLSISDEVMGAVWEGVRRREGAEEGEEEGKSESEDKEMVARELSTLVKTLPSLGLVVPVNSTPLKLEVEYEVMQWCM